MSWVKIDDGMPDHPKIVQLSDAAFRLHIAAMCYSSRYGLDGRIPGDWPGVRRRTVLVNSLVKAGVWVRTVGQSGEEFQIHDFLEYNPSAAERKALSESRAKAGRIGGQAKPQAIASASASDSAQAKRKPSPPLPSPSPEESLPGTQSKPPTSSISGGGEPEAPSSRVLAAQGRAEHLKAKMMAEVQKTRRVPWVFPETEIRHIRGLLQSGLPTDAIMAAWRAYVGAMKDPGKISVYYFTTNINRWVADAARSREE